MEINFHSVAIRQHTNGFEQSLHQLKGFHKHHRLENGTFQQI